MVHLPLQWHGITNMKGVFVTVNTDAGFSYKYQIGTYAFWIKGTGKHLHGSGVFKEKHKGPMHKGPYEMEIKAIINALAVIKKTDHPPIIGFIFNRDNIYAKSRKNGDALQKLLYQHIRHFRKDAEKRLGLKAFMAATRKQKEYAQFRYVKAHNGTPDKRSYVNDWCDRQCKLQFEKWYNKYIKTK